jgi:hypothetical protein
MELKPVIDDMCEHIIVKLQNDSDNSREEDGGKEEVLEEEAEEHKLCKMFLSHCL